VVLWGGAAARAPAQLRVAGERRAGLEGVDPEGTSGRRRAGAASPEAGGSETGDAGGDRG
jgi:hypothetical protein